MIAQITYFFEGVQEASKGSSASLGWTETWYGNDTTVTSLDQWLRQRDVTNYATLRRSTLDPNYRVVFIRASDVANPRSFKLFSPDGMTGTDKPNTLTGGKISFAQVQCALLVDIVRLPDNPAVGHTHHRKFLMRALPSDVINGNVLSTTGQNWPAIQTFLDWLATHETGAAGIARGAGPFPTNSTLGLRYQNEGFLNFTASAAVVANQDARTITVSAVLPGTPLVSRYEFRDFPDSMRALNRIWTLLAVAGNPPNSTVLGTARRDLPTESYAAGGRGRYRLVNPSYNPPSQYTIIGLRTKKTGRLFRQLRGRSRSR